MNNHGMGNGMMMTPPSPSPPHNMTMAHHKRMMMMMQMTFYWGKNAEILFSGWPGTHTPMYIFSLIFVFLLAFLVEWLSNSRLVPANANAVTSGMLLTLLHTLRVGLANLSMLAVMSFNGGIFVAVVAGHAIGFMLFGTRVFGSGRTGSEDPNIKTSNQLPPMACAC